LSRFITGKLVKELQQSKLRVLQQVKPTLKYAAMKIKISSIVLLFFISSNQLQAQHVRVRLNFPVNISIGAPARAPFGGAIWIGPEWQWRNGRYVSVPGYWARPQRHRAIWVPGYWQYTRRGYRWMPGYWR